MIKKNWKILIPLVALLFVFLFLATNPVELISNPQCYSGGAINAVCWLDGGQWYCLYLDDWPDCTHKPHG